MLIGRCARQSSLRIGGLDVARLHCLVIRQPGRISLEDLENTNEIWIKGRGIRCTDLEGMAIVLRGQILFLFVLSDSGASVTT